ncbi:MAG: hypothetical protein FJ091_19065 [Deltaproteobacteria bacterium]|nr:hypothetical protein [Deltaproteobacteria bacterium]
MRRIARFVSVLALASALLAPARSGALTLQDLNAGASFTTTGGELTFEFAAGSIGLSGTLPVDLSQYTVVPTATGFIVSGPLAVIGPAAFGGVSLAYQVSAGAGLALNAATLQTSGIAFGPGAIAIATTGMSNGANLGVLLTQAGGTGSNANASFVATQLLSTLAGLQLFGMTPGDVAGFGSVQHGFSWVALPEPGVMLLLAAGLGGLALFARRLRAA